MAPPLSYGQLARKTTPFNPYIDIINQIPSNITAASLVQPPSLKVAEKLYELPKLKVTPLPKQPEIKVSSYKKYKDLRRMLDEEEKEEEKKPSIWTRIKEEQMGLKKIRQVGEFGKTILQQPQRAITSIGLETAAAILSLAKGKKVEPIFTPESKFEKFVFGEEPIVGIFERTKRAQETSENILVNYLNIDEDISTGASLALAPIIIGGLTGLDLFPVGGGKKQIAKQSIKIAKLSNVDEILRILKGIFKESDETLKPLADNLININKVDDVKKVLTGFGKKIKPGVTKVGKEIPKKLEPVADVAKKSKNEFDFLNSTIEVPIESVNPISTRKQIIGKLGKIESRTIDLPVTAEIKNGKINILDGSQRFFNKLDRGDKTIKIRFSPVNTGEVNPTAKFFQQVTQKLVKPSERFKAITGAIEETKPTISKVKNIADTETAKVSKSTPSKLINEEKLLVGKESQKKVRDFAESIRPELERVKGAPLTHKEITEAARQSDILRRITTRESTKIREATILKTKQHLAALSKGEGVSPEFVETLKRLSDEGTNLGRQLESLKISAIPELATSKANIIKQLLKNGNDIDDIIKAAKGVDFDNLKELTKFYRKFVKPTLPELVDEYRYINLLSSPRTHIVNAFTNLLQTTFLAPATKLYTGAIDIIGSTLTGKARQAYVSEVPAYYRGAFNSIDEAVKGVMDVMAGRRKIYRPDIGQIPTGNKWLSKFQIVPLALEAGDVFFRSLLKGGEKEALSLRFLKQGKPLTDDVLAKIAQQADDSAAYYVFRKAIDPSDKTGQGYLLSSIDKMTNAIYKFRKVPGVKWFIPFVQTPMNILKQGIEFSPLGLATLPKNINKTEQLAKAMIGSTVMLGAGNLAMQGRLTWKAPTGEAEKELFYASGRKPYSIQIGNRWVSYSKLGPLAYPIAMAAAINWYMRENPKAATEDTLKKTLDVFSGIVQFFSDQSYVQGMKNLTDVLSGEPGAWLRTLTQIPSQMIPLSSLQRWTAQLIDPIYRQPKLGTSLQGIVEQLSTGLPFVSKDIEPYTTPTGEPSRRQRVDLISPASISPISPEFEEQLQEYREAQAISAVSTKERTEFKDRAEIETENLKALQESNPAQAKEKFDEIIKSDPTLAKEINKILLEKKDSLTPADKKIKSLGVENGDRAEIILRKLDRLETDEEKAEFWNDYVKKKILTKEVAKQIKKLIAEKE